MPAIWPTATGWRPNRPRSSAIVPAGSVVVSIVLYAAAWTLMTVAMMLPTTLPLFAAFDRLTAQRADHARLLMLLGLGYMTVWGAFGLLAHPLHAAMLSLVDSVPALAWNGWLIAAVIIATAGAFQFSSLKYRCLEKCRRLWLRHRALARAPAPRVHARRTPRAVPSAAAKLMLLMFVVGTGSPAGCSVAAVMAIEKTFAGAIV
jgi:predicted metal-binding membrane protein